MDKEVADGLYAHAETHWWNRSRRRIVRSLLERYVVGGRPLILDLGCGVGTHLNMLSEIGEVWGADPSPLELDYCRSRFSGRLDCISLPDQVPYEDKTFDVVVMLDVLEHIEDDAGALACIRDILKPGGVLLLTVPALNWLWTQYDVHAHHYRRYHRRPLLTLLQKAGFQIRLLSYMNFFLFPLMAASRVLLPGSFWNAKQMTGRGNNRMVRGLFEALFSFERHLLPWVRLPIGGSLVAVAARPVKAAPAQEPPRLRRRAG
ncbi:MAG TPA: class I SAM-dependent methyltransferase [Gemmataceae bacterium]|jgi:SAM-dependent methyltransferase